MTRDSWARGLLFNLAGVAGVALAGGVGLAAFATGGDLNGMATSAAAETRLGANPDSIVPDGYASADLGPVSYGQVRCQDCGPGIAERRALERSRRFEAQLARYSAHLDEQMAEPVIEPASYFEVKAPPRETFEALGELPVLAEAAGTIVQSAN